MTNPPENRDPYGIPMVLFDIDNIVDGIVASNLLPPEYIEPLKRSLKKAVLARKPPHNRQAVEHLASLVTQEIIKKYGHLRLK